MEQELTLNKSYYITYSIFIIIIYIPSFQNLLTKGEIIEKIFIKLIKHTIVLLYQSLEGNTKLNLEFYAFEICLSVDWISI